MDQLRVSDGMLITPKNKRDVMSGLLPAWLLRFLLFQGRMQGFGGGGGVKQGRIQGFPKGGVETRDTKCKGGGGGCCPL